ncbi:hypothetical protein B2G71_08490 [Novosphingobium sp. PC22D]|nr:hypothetical protein B2G71_08490 [Novosphingobium sp. PC22D]
MVLTMSGMITLPGQEASAQEPGTLPAEWLGQGRSDYMEYCAGCHGVNGKSAPALVPELRGRVGYFMCTKSGRDYLVQLPNVAHAPIPGEAELANLLNYVVFVLGDGSAPDGTRPFTPREVGKLRLNPIQNRSLVGERARLVQQLVSDCGAPASLAGFFEGDAHLSAQR